MSLWYVAAAGALAGVAAALFVPPPPGQQWRTVASPASSPEPVEGIVRFRAVLCPAAGLGAMFLVGGKVGIGVGLVVAVTVWQAVTRMEPPAHRRRREQLVAALPHVVDLMASSLAVGSSPSTAVQLAAMAVDRAMREELLLITSRLALGVDPVRVWTEVGHHPQLGALGRALARATESGAPVSEAMARLGEDLRRDARAEVESRARAVGVKAAAPLGLCLLPAFILVGIVPLVAGSIGTVLNF